MEQEDRLQQPKKVINDASYNMVLFLLEGQS